MITSATPPSRRAAREREREEKRTTHIKKPLNAFMLYMKEMRPKIVAECTLKESAAINQILGRRVSKSETSFLNIFNKNFMEMNRPFKISKVLQIVTLMYSTFLLLRKLSNLT